MRILCVCMILFVLAGCKKDETTSVEPGSEPDYTPMSVGSYWVYEDYRIDTAGVETKMNKPDSIVVTGDTMINGNKYAIIQGNLLVTTGYWEVLGVVRDSSHYLVDYHGQILFSSQNFTDTLAKRVEVTGTDTLFVGIWKMQALNETVHLPAGSFSNVLGFLGEITSHNPPSWQENPRYIETYYAPGVGKIFESNFFFNSSERFERRLIRYHIE